MVAHDERAIILAYHSVAEGPDYASPSIQVTKAEFERQISHLAAHYNLVKLSDVANSLDGDWNLPPRSVAITFDDGYSDNIDNALPILKSYNAPASLFVTVCPAINGSPFWVGRLERATQTAPSFSNLSKYLNLPVELANFKQAFVTAAKHINLKSGDDRKAAIDRIEEALKNDGAFLPPAPDDFMATTRQLKLWHESGMEVGAHSLTHPILTSLDDDEAQSELSESKHELEQQLGINVSSLAYPNGPGVLSNVDERIVSQAQSAGFKYGVTSKRGAVMPSSSALALPRIAVNHRIRGNAFKWKLERGFSQQAPNLPIDVRHMNS